VSQDLIIKTEYTKDSPELLLFKQQTNEPFNASTILVKR